MGFPLTEALYKASSIARGTWHYGDHLNRSPQPHSNIDLMDLKPTSFAAINQGCQVPSAALPAVWPVAKRADLGREASITFTCALSREKAEREGVTPRERELALGSPSAVPNR